MKPLAALAVALVIGAAVALATADWPAAQPAHAGDAAPASDLRMVVASARG